MMSADDQSSRVSATTVAPALRKASSSKFDSGAGAALDADGESQFLQLRDDLGRGRHAHFSVVNFSGNADSHCVCSRTFGGASGEFMLSMIEPVPLEGSIGGTTARQYTVPGSTGPRTRYAGYFTCAR